MESDHPASSVDSAALATLSAPHAATSASNLSSCVSTATVTTDAHLGTTLSVVVSSTRLHDRVRANTAVLNRIVRQGSAAHLEVNNLLQRSGLLAVLGRTGPCAVDGVEGFKR